MKRKNFPARKNARRLVALKQRKKDLVSLDFFCSLEKEEKKKKEKRIRKESSNIETKLAGLK